jgi:1-acyl-sn-glycerol-3-phosphate acyltransferase
MTDATLPPRWPWLFKLFRDYAPKYAAKHLHAVRVARDLPPPQGWSGPAIVVMNHPSWWDPIMGYVACRFWPDRLDYAPIDASALRKYKFLGKAGLFGIEPGTVRGAREFLRVARTLLKNDRATLWITAQGGFTDVRVRPVTLRNGIGHAAAAMESGVVIPMAVEYPFWNESKAEGLIGFGPAIDARTLAGGDPAEVTRSIASALEATMDRLAELAQTRDASKFETIVAGQAGVGGVYDLGRRFRALVTGRRFQAAHES